MKCKLFGKCFFFYSNVKPLNPMIFPSALEQPADRHRITWCTNNCFNPPGRVVFQARAQNMTRKVTKV